jgi:hypothetical protein
MRLEVKGAANLIALNVSKNRARAALGTTEELVFRILLSTPAARKGKRWGG